MKFMHWVVVVAGAVCASAPFIQPEVATGSKAAAVLAFIVTLAGTLKVASLDQVSK